ncbi:MAG: hypothetical protein RL885_29370 [Planctomycetota bacterium]
MLRQVALTLTILFLTAGWLRADVIHLKDGRKLEGEIIEETTTHVTIKLAFGEQKIERGKIKEIVKKAGPREELDERRKALGKKDVKGRLELAEFAEKNRLRKEAEELFEEVLEIEPDNETAHEGLGHVTYRGEWVTKAERRRLEKKADEAKLEESGRVKYKGRWVEAEEKEALEKGLVKVGDEWITPEEKKQRDEEKRMIARGMVQYEGRWVEAEALPHLEKGEVQVRGRWMSVEEADKIRAHWDEAWELDDPKGRFLLRTSRPKQEADLLYFELQDAIERCEHLYGRSIEGTPIFLYVVSDLDAYREYADQYGGGEKSSGSGCFLIQNPESVINPRSGPAGWDELRGVTYYYVSQGKPRHTINWIHHLAAEQFTKRLSKDRAPHWFQQSFAAYLEKYRIPLERSVAEMELKKLGQPVSLNALMNEFYVGPEQDQARANFLTGGYLVAYLLETDHEADRDGFRKYLDLVAKGEVDDAAFRRLLGDPDALEQRMREHLGQ